jgi:hypothetical protein
MKGLLEEAVKALGFAKLTIFNPPVLIRKKIVIEQLKLPD